MNLSLIMAAAASDDPSSGVSIVRLVLLAICLILSSFFSAAEIALSSINSTKIQVLVEEGKKGAKKTLKITEKFDRTLSSILIGNNIVNITLATLSTAIFVELLKSQSLGEFVSTAVVTVVVLAFGEIVPKSLAKRNPESFSLKISFVIYYLNYILLPISIIFIGLQKLVNLGSKDKVQAVTEGELEIIIDQMNEQGIIESDESELIKSVLSLNDVKVADIMVPRVDMIVIPYDEDIDKIKKIFFQEKFSRIPVYQDDKDNIIGILYERDFFTKLIQGKKINLRSIMKPVKYVSRSTKVDDLIHELQRAKMHMAIVSGPDGETAGLVTMEDALEVLVGEIYDEHDEVEGDSIKKISDTEYEIDASVPIDEIFDKLGIGKAPEAQYKKLSGWLYSLVEDVPKKGDQIIYTSDYIAKDSDDEYVDFKKRLTFTIKDVEDRRIMCVFLKIEDVSDIEEE